TTPAAHSTNARALACVCATPFGRPVEPDVYRMYESDVDGTSTGGRHRSSRWTADKLWLTGGRSADLPGSNQSRPSQGSAGELSPGPSCAGEASPSSIACIVRVPEITATGSASVAMVFARAAGVR